MKLSTTLLPLALIACNGEPPINIDTGPEDGGVLPATVDFDSGKVASMVVETVNGSIDLQPGGEAGGVRVDVVRQDQAESWDYFLQDQVLQMWPLCENGVLGCSSGFAIGAPATMEAYLSTVSGETKISDYNGNVTIENTQGLVTGLRLKGGNLVATGNSATMNIEFLNEPESVELTTIDGTINLEIPRGTYNLDVTTNGVRSLIDPTTLIQGDGPTILIKSTSGDVTVTGVE